MLWSWLAVVCCLVCLSPAAQDLSERQLRARFLMNFVRFAEWPAGTFANPSTPLQVCAMGALDPFDGALQEFRDMKIGERPVAIKSPVAASLAAGCHVLYVPDDELVRLPVARQAIGSTPALVVGESESVLDRGGMIGLRSLDRRLGFAVNLAAARRANIKLSTQMLKLAIEVRE